MKIRRLVDVLAEISEEISLKDLSDYLRISEKRIKSMVKKKEIPFSLHEGIVTFYKVDIDKWIDSKITY